MARTFNGTTDIVAGTITAIADGDWTGGAWILPASAGEGNLGRIFDINDAGSGGVFNFFVTTGLVLSGQLHYATTDCASTSSTTFTASTWMCVFITHRASDNKARLFQGSQSVAVAETAYTTQTAGVGAFTVAGTLAKLGNRTDAARTFDGRIHSEFLLPREMSVDEMEQFRLGDWGVLWNGTVIPRFFCPMDSPTAAQIEDLSGNSVAFTATGTTASEGAPVPGGFQGTF